MSAPESPVWIERSEIYTEGRNIPEVSYMISNDDDRMSDLTYERLIAIRDLINRLEENREGEKKWASILSAARIV